MPDINVELPTQGVGCSDAGPEAPYTFHMQDAWDLLATKRRLLLLVTLGVMTVAGVIAFLLPDEYTAMAMVVPPQKDRSAAAAILGQLGPLASFAGGDMGMKASGDLYVGILGSRTIADHIIKRFELKEVYKIKTLVDTRKKLAKRAQFTVGQKDTLLRIEVDDYDARRAAAIANEFVSELNIQNKQMAATDAGQRRAFFERQLTDERQALAATEDSMKRLQERSGLIQLDSQTSLAIGSLAQLRAQITSGEVMLDRLKMGATANNPEVVRAEAELAALRAQLKKMERSSDMGLSLVPASSLPEKGLDYIRGVRDLKYREILVEFLAKQYEAARIDESKAAPDLQVIDPAIAPDKKSGPPRATIIGVSGAVALLLAVLILCYTQRDSLA